MDWISRGSASRRGAALRSATLGFTLAALAGSAFAGDEGKWHVGMVAVFTGFLCNEPIDAVHGLVAALDLSAGSTFQESRKVEESLHCFPSDGPVKFLGRIPKSKMFVDPEKGRFLFVAFDIGGGVTAYGWVGEAYASDDPEPPRDHGV